MSFPLIKAAAVSCVLSGLAFTGQAFALPAPQLEPAPFVIQVIDEQDAVEEALEPDVMLPGSQEGGNAAGSRGGGESGGGGDEVNELQRAFPSTNWPPSDRQHKD